MPWMVTKAKTGKRNYDGYGYALSQCYAKVWGRFGGSLCPSVPYFLGRSLLTACSMAFLTPHTVLTVGYSKNGGVKKTIRFHHGITGKISRSPKSKLNFNADNGPFSWF